MKRSRLWLTSILIGLVLLLSGARRKKQARLKQQRPANAGSGHPNNQIDAAPVVSLDQVQEASSAGKSTHSQNTDRQDHPSRPHEPPDQWRKAEVYFAGAIALFTLVLSIVSAIQSCIGNKAANAAKESADAEVAANRAWIVPSTTKTWMVGKTYLAFEFDWVNAGKSPAVNIRATEEFKIDPNATFRRRMRSIRADERWTGTSGRIFVIAAAVPNDTYSSS